VDFAGTIYVHLVTDGRDTSPERAGEQVAELKAVLASLPAPERCRIATVSGRFYAMDRDNRWERTKRAFDAIVHGTGHAAADPIAWIEESYRNKITDEFIEPAVFDYNGAGPEDGILFWNFRTDRMRQIVAALCVEPFDGFERATVPFPARADADLHRVRPDVRAAVPFLGTDDHQPSRARYRAARADSSCGSRRARSTRT
jgi:2,3-bisphosphoglycerate-independent phosphoglycerate mutase